MVNKTVKYFIKYTNYSQTYLHSKPLRYIVLYQIYWMSIVTTFNAVAHTHAQRLIHCEEQLLVGVCQCVSLHVFLWRSYIVSLFSRKA